MATVTEEKKPTAPNPATQARLVDQQIQRTRRELKLIDFGAGLMTLTIGVLLFLLTASVLEHWVIPGGWGDTARMALFLMLLGGVGWYSWRTFWPLVSRPINPAFAAQVIERNSPSLKNSLLNLLLLRDRRQQLSQRVYQAIEQQAEQRISDTSVDFSVDRSTVLRLGYVLLAVVALAALYLLLSPKNLTDSIERVLMPWSTAVAPSRVQIVDVSPGNTEIARGERITITTEILGLGSDEPVRLRYSTADGQTVGRDVPMTGSPDGVEFECRLPDRLSAHENGGIQQDLTYRIFAGDARSPEYKVSVYARPTLIVDRVRYEYPTYTGLSTREETGTGDISAIEGTKVSLFAQANQEIDTAHVDFEANGRHDLLMKSEGRQSHVAFPLALRDDRRTPRYSSYVLRYKTTAGRTNVQPPQYQIEVTPDYAPEISLLAPEEEVLDVALNEPFTIEVEARDPDFALRNVTILGEVAGRQIVKHDLLDSTHTGRFSQRFTTTAAELNLRVGNVLDYWAVAADNRRPEANVTSSERRQIRVVEREFPEQEDQVDGDQQGPGGGGGAGDDGSEGDQQDGPGEAASGDGSEDAERSDEGGAPGEQGDNDDLSGDQGGSDQQQQGPGEGEPSADGQAGREGDTQQERDDQAFGDDQQQPGEQGQPGEQSRVSPEGDDDGTAFEQMAQHFDEQDGELPQDAASSKEGANGEGTGDTTDRDFGDGLDSETTGDEGRSDDLAPDSDGIEGAQQDRTDDGTGAEGEPSEQVTDDEQRDPEGEEGQEAPGGEMSPEQGDPGAGERSGEQQGSPDSHERKPTEKTQESDDHLDLESEEPPSRGEDETESDSDGGQAGDMTGGGEEGGGQQADDEGTGTAGENQATDDGAGQAGEPGEGEAGAQPGQDELADQQTGESSEDQPGDGTEDAPADVGEHDGAEGEPGQQPGEGPPGEGQPGESEPGEMPEGDPADASDPGQAGSEPGGDGTGGDATPPPPGEMEPGDEANLDYARQQTDLVLDRLEDQLKKQDVDEQLLDKLGWSEEDLRRFVDRWRKLKDDAENGAASGASDELDAALRSLGLDPNRRTGFRSQTIQDKLRDYSEAYRGRTPVEYADRVRAYIKGTATQPDDN